MQEKLGRKWQTRTDQGQAQVVTQRIPCTASGRQQALRALVSPLKYRRPITFLCRALMFVSGAISPLLYSGGKAIADPAVAEQHQLLLKPGVAMRLFPVCDCVLGNTAMQFILQHRYSFSLVSRPCFVPLVCITSRLQKSFSLFVGASYFFSTFPVSHTIQ